MIGDGEMVTSPWVPQGIVDERELGKKVVRCIKHLVNKDKEWCRQNPVETVRYYTVLADAGVFKEPAGMPRIEATKAGKLWCRPWVKMGEGNDWVVLDAYGSLVGVNLTEEIADKLEEMGNAS